MTNDKIDTRANTMRYLVLAITGLSLFALMRYVRLYGDDFFYYQFAQNGFNHFINHHIEHYFRANGRVIVHILATLFLYLPPIIWQIANAIMLTGIAYYGGHIASENPKDRLRVTILFSIALFFLHIHLTRQSVYWLIGSLNYVYPVFVLMAFWAAFIKAQQQQKFRLHVYILCLLSAASTEQIGMVTIGLVTLYALQSMWKQKKLDLRYVLFGCIAVLGVASVVLSPSVWVRIAQEDAPAQGLVQLVKYNILSLARTVLSPVCAPYVGITFVAFIWTCILDWRIKRSGLFVRLFVTIGSLALIIPWLMLKTGQTYYSFDWIKGNALLLFFFAFLFASLFMWFLYWHYAAHQKPTFWIALILAIGAQMMMLVSPVYGSRNYLCSILVMLLALSQFCLQPLFYERTLQVLLVIALGVSLFVFSSTFNGYRTNHVVYDENMVRITQWQQTLPKDQPSVLDLHMLPIEEYGWAMPYHNPYYDTYYNLTFSLPPRLRINWIKP